MKEILFKGKCINNNKWVFGNYIFIEQQHYIFENEPSIYIVDFTTVSRYTGLNDTKGNKIFEGDIVSFKRDNALGYTTNRIGDIRYCNKLSIFYIMATTGDAWDWTECRDITIIGNIYDNPDLLKKE